MRSQKMKNLNASLSTSFFKVAMYIVGPFLATRGGYKYILVAIDHYSKWSEAKAILDHGAKIGAKFLKDEIICRYGITRFILINNRGKWSSKFDVPPHPRTLTMGMSYQGPYPTNQVCFLVA